MVRYYRRRYRPYSKKSNWAVETKSVTIATNTSLSGAVATKIVPEEAGEGIRTVKNISISMSIEEAFRWAIVYVPGGTEVGTLNQEPITGTTGSTIVNLYEPNQYVMAAGTYDPGAGPNRIFCPLARKLNSDDRIFLLMRAGGNTQILSLAVVRYAIKYN